MIAFGLAVLSFGAICVLFSMFVAWVIREHLMAEAFRRHSCEEFVKKMMAKHPPTSSNGEPRWEVVYRVGRKTETKIITGATEALALREFVKGLEKGYKSIVSSTKV